VHVEPDPTRASATVRSAASASCIPILVLSKRRTGERAVSRSRGSVSSGGVGLEGLSRSVMHLGAEGGGVAALAQLAAGDHGDGAVL